MEVHKEEHIKESHRLRIISIIIATAMMRTLLQISLNLIRKILNLALTMSLKIFFFLNFVALVPKKIDLRQLNSRFQISDITFRALMEVKHHRKPLQEKRDCGDLQIFYTRNWRSLMTGMLTTLWFWSKLT